MTDDAPIQLSPKGKAIGAGIIAALAAAAAFGVGIAMGWPWVWDINDPEFNPMLFFEAALTGVTVWHLVKAARWALRHRAFGTVRLDLDGPLQLGKALSGRVCAERPVAATGPFRITLTCHDIHEFDGDDAAGRERIPFPVWTTETSLPAETDARQGLRFRFVLPASVGPDPVPSGIVPGGLRRSRVTVHVPGHRRVVAQNHPPVDRVWTLTVTAPTQGPDFQAELPVS